MLYYVAIFWLAGGLIFDAVTVAFGSEDISPSHQVASSLVAILAWPIVLSITLFRQRRDGGI